MEILRDTNIDFMKYRKAWIIVSLALIVVAIFAVFVHGNLNVGVDFAGGTQMTVKFRERPDVQRLRELLDQAGLPEVAITTIGREEENEISIRTRLEEGSAEGSRERVEAAFDRAFNAQAAGKPDINRIGAQAIAGVLAQANPDRLAATDPEAVQAHYQGAAQAIVDARTERGLFSSWDNLRGIQGVSPAVVSSLNQQTSLGGFTVLSVETVGPQIGEELRRQGFYAVVLSLLGMLVYIWLRFELRFGIGAIMGCVHDVIVTLGLFAILGFEFNLTTIAAFLTVVGYSVNDTVVIFDRIRENMRKSRREPLIEVMNKSINQTLSRTVLTGGSTLLVLACLLYWGGEAIRGFAFVIFVGIIVGTYSSIYIAPPFTLLWEKYFGNCGSKIRGQAAPVPAGGAASTVQPRPEAPTRRRAGGAGR